MNHEQRKMMNKSINEMAHRIVATLRDLIGLEVEVEMYPEPRVKISNGGRIEARLCIRSQLRPSTIGLVLNECKPVKPAMVFSQFISRPIAKTLKDNKIWFADPLGNVYIEVPGKLFVYTIGKTPIITENSRSTILTESGAKLLLYLLTHGPQIKATYRKIAGETGISLGRTSYLIRALLDSGIIRKGDKKYIVEDGKQLFEIWGSAYIEKLKPKRFLGVYISKYRSNLTKLFEAMRELSLPMGIGDELAGEILTNYLKAKYASLWIRSEDLELIKDTFKLLKTDQGNIKVYELFNSQIVWWSPQKGIMPVPMVIADLLETNDVRNRETAVMLQERFLKWTL